tara:strand:+ start:112 stop:483 length:372 start_codon:yes stop_codon:yes gene_type:complete
MKFIFSISLLLVVSSMFLVPVLVQAAAPVTDIPEAYRLGEKTNVPTTGATLITRIQLIANWVFGIFLAISLIFIIVGAFQFVTAGGDPAKVSEARQKLMYAVIGIAIGLLVLGIPAIIRNIVV